MLGATRYKMCEVPIQRFVDWPGREETSWELMLKAKGWGEWEGQERDSLLCQGGYER